MISGLRQMLFTAVLLAWSVGGALAGTLVEFPNVSERAPKLVGYLARPDRGLSALLGAGGLSADRYPAVVVLHGCSGISSHSAGIADRLGSWGMWR
jgi:dienelactone hydrolase